jgi:FlaA1/EpsC-like NDP-sugar epimerase
VALTGKSYRRASLVFLHDVAMAAIALLLALWLRLDEDFARVLPAGAVVQWLALYTAGAVVVFWVAGLYRGVWRYASLEDLMQVVKAATALMALFLVGLFVLSRLELFPRSVVLLAWITTILLLAGPRIGYRYIKDGRIAIERQGQALRQVLVVGADDEAAAFARAARRAGSGLVPVGMLAIGEGRVGREIAGVRVVGTVGDLASAVAALKARGQKPDVAAIATDRLAGPALAKLVAEAETAGLMVARLPSPTDLDGGRVDLAPIALEDLLGRSTVELDREGMRRLIAGRRVLLTGAGGSIGSELARRIASFAPARLALVDASEYALYAIDLELGERWGTIDRAAIIADVRDAARIDALFAAERPELVFHAAALKHVPLVEANPLEGIATNTLGTRIVADAAVAHGVATMVVISTDKAVNATNVMGATKRAGEIYTQGLDLEGTATRLVTVRFGNVLGSTGSVVPLFERQLKAGGPLTVTHEDVTRYFMTIPEAVDLVLQASVAGTTSDAFRGRIFVLEMGPPIRIVDLARQMIRLAGKRPDIDVKIAITGLRPGEKLFEELFHGEEPPVATGTGGVLLAAARPSDLGATRAAFAALAAAVQANDTERGLAVLRDLVPDYRPAPPRERVISASENPVTASPAATSAP